MNTTKTCELDGRTMTLERKTQDLRFTEVPWYWQCPAGHTAPTSEAERPGAPDKRFTL
jgi:hypothetical protein